MKKTTHTCEAPIAWDDLVDYWSGDMAPARVDAIDEQTMACGACSAASARAGAVTDALSAMIPPFIDRARVSALRDRGFVIIDNVLGPDERRAVTFASATDFLMHRLGGLDLSDAERVSVSITVEETGDVLLTVPSVPFDRAVGEVIIACQRHFAAFPPNIVAVVRSHTSSGTERVARYPIPHVFELRPGERF